MREISAATAKTGAGAHSNNNNWSCRGQCFCAVTSRRFSLFFLFCFFFLRRPSLNRLYDDEVRGFAAVGFLSVSRCYSRAKNVVATAVRFA